MKIEEIPIREIRWSGRSRFLLAQPLWGRSMEEQQEARERRGCSRIIPGRL